MFMGSSFGASKRAQSREEEIANSLSHGFGLLWLIAGGLAYTLGVIFFALDSRLRYGHFIWHLFVMAGTACHYFAVLWYAA